MSGGLILKGVLPMVTVLGAGGLFMLNERRKALLDAESNRLSFSAVKALHEQDYEKFYKLLNRAVDKCGNDDDCVNKVYAKFYLGKSLSENE